jgi:hypothetical protein
MAFAKHARVIPVLVDEAAMPGAASVPQRFKHLENFTALDFVRVRSGGNFDSDMARVFDAIERRDTAGQMDSIAAEPEATRAAPTTSTTAPTPPRSPSPLGIDELVRLRGTARRRPLPPASYPGGAGNGWAAAGAAPPPVTASNAMGAPIRKGRGWLLAGTAIAGGLGALALSLQYFSLGALGPIGTHGPSGTQVASAPQASVNGPSGSEVASAPPPAATGSSAEDAGSADSSEPEAGAAAPGSSTDLGSAPPTAGSEAPMAGDEASGANSGAGGLPIDTLTGQKQMMSRQIASALGPLSDGELRLIDLEFERLARSDPYGLPGSRQFKRVEAKLRREIQKRRALGIYGSVPPLAAGAASDKSDLVDVSAYAPGQVTPESPFLVQLLLHVEEASETARAMAEAADPGTDLRATTTLEVELKRGARVQVALEAKDFTVDDEVQLVTWRGKTLNCQFLLNTRPNTTVGLSAVTARLLLDGIPIGKLVFSLKVVPGHEPAETVMHGELAQRYSRAFLSYASEDRADVLKRVDVLRVAGIEYFQDILSLTPGEQWNERLYAEIERSDLFLLFWSSHAAKSEWVTKETEHALKVRARSAPEHPDIMPIILEGPPVPLPPEALKSIHFNDFLRYVIAAVEAEKRGEGRPVQ